MLVMVIVGFMNLPWMVLLTLVIFVEKTWSYGDRLSFLMGIGLHPRCHAGLHRSRRSLQFSL